MTKKALISENALQRQIVDWIRIAAPGVVVVAVPNAARRTVSGRPTNAVAGLTAGVPDLVVIRPRGEVLWLEVKTNVGKVSDAQFAFHSKLMGLDHRVAVVRSLEDVKLAFKTLGIKTRETINEQVSPRHDELG